MALVDNNPIGCSWNGTGYGLINLSIFSDDFSRDLLLRTSDDISPWFVRFDSLINEFSWWGDLLRSGDDILFLDGLSYGDLLLPSVSKATRL